MDKSAIDISKLENCKSQPDGSFICACPCCRENGNDKTGNHLRVWPNLAFNCIVDQSVEHNKRILQLVGTNIDINNLDYVAPQKQEPRVTMDKQWPLSILDGLIKNHDYWINRGISSQTMDYFCGGIATKGQLQNRYVLPFLNKQKTHIIGFTGRALKPDMKPKYKHLGSMGDVLFPYTIGEKYDTILLVESPGCNLKLWDNGIKGHKCLFGLNIGSAVMSYLIETNPKKIKIGTNNEPDNKEIGLKAAEKIKKKLLQFFNEDRIDIALPPKKDFGDCSNEEIKQYAIENDLI